MTDPPPGGPGGQGVQIAPPLPLQPQQQQAANVMMNQVSNSPGAVESVAISSRLSEFWPDQPRVWFIRTEAILTPQRLSDEAKFDLIISKLNKEVIAQVTDIIINPPATGKYEALKNRLLTIYEESHTRQIEKLMSELDLGDQKPSQLLRRMKELATDKFSDETLRVLWQNRLPSQVRAVLAVSESKDLESLAAVADTVMDVTRPNQIAEVTQRGSRNLDTALIMAEIAKLNVKILDLERSRSSSRQQQFQRRGRSRSTSRGRSSSRRPRSENWLCFYHHRFKENARKCVQPCAWKKPSEN